MSLTEEEIDICKRVNIDPEDALFLKSLSGRPIQLLKFDNADEAGVKGIYGYAPYPKGTQIALDHYDRFRQTGKLLYVGEWHLLDEQRTFESRTSHVAGDDCEMMCLVHCNDPIDIVRLNQVSWGNCDIRNEQVVEILKKWDATFGIKIFSCTADYIGAMIVNPEIDYTALATEIFSLCSYPLNTNTTIEETAASMKKYGQISLWWD